MKNIYWSIICVIFLCGSCGQSDSEEIESFEVVKNIVDFDSIYSDKNSPSGIITAIDVFDHMIIAEHGDDEQFFSFIDIENGRLLRKWGNRGKGRNEYIRLGAGFSINDSALVFLDEVKQEVNYVPIEEVLDSVELQIKKDPYPYTRDFRPFHMIMIGRWKIAVGGFTDGRFGILDSLGQVVHCSFDYPFDMPDEIDGIYRGVVFQSQIKSSQKQSKFVLHVVYSDIFEIYEIKGGKPYRIYVSPFNYVPQIKEARNMNRYALDSRKNIVGLTKMAVSDNLIAFLYSTDLCWDFRKGTQQLNTVLCFDWNGNKVAKYILPIAVNGFCIDSEYIYGYRYDGDETVFYRFKMT